MHRILQLISFLALVGVILPPALYLAGTLDKGPMATVMIISTLAWFASAPFWMERKG
ncbi:MAG: hypothetical protein E1N59_3178 [Puniceicoccaceae bacterium 5H]|nr:MAG: hypothetical protein E1N59_3178 [Puniceicoccaceae bacterium 5H]